MRTLPRKSHPLAGREDRAADTPATASTLTPRVAVVAGTFTPLGFAADGVLDRVRHAREAAQKVLNNQERDNER